MSDDDMIRRGDALAKCYDNVTMEAIRALPARGVGVKPLVWEGDETELHDLIACPDPFHTYTVRPLGELRFDVILNHELGSLWFRQRKGEIWPDYASAKAAAQADYEARILAALEPAPTDAAQAREAALAMLNLHDDFLAGKPVDLVAANCLHLAASFGAQAFAVCPEPDARPSAMLRAFLLAMIDPMHPDLDYLRAKNVARLISEART